MKGGERVEEEKGKVMGGANREEGCGEGSNGLMSLWIRKRHRTGGNEGEDN